MKIYNYIPALLLLTGALAACQSDEALTSAYENDPNAVRITAGIAAPQTRVNTAGNGDAWEANDRIKVINVSANAVAGKSEAVYEYDGSAWGLVGTDYMVWADGTNSFQAFYPYDASKNDSFNTFTLPNDQSGDYPTLANYIGKADWMTCWVEQSQSSTLDLTFEHKLAKVTVKIVKYKNQYNILPLVENPVFGLPTEKLEEGLTLNVEGDATSIKALTTREETEHLHSFTAILLPGTYAADDDFLSLEVGGTTYTVKAGTNEVLTGDGLKMGTAYEFTLTVGKDKVTLGDVTVEEWEESDWTEDYGGTAGEELIPELTSDPDTHTLTLGEQGQLAALMDDECQTMLDEVIGDGTTLKINGPMEQSDFFKLDTYFYKKEPTVHLDLSGADFTALPSQAFCGVYSITTAKLKSVTLPDKCTSIGGNAFYNMSLEYVTAPGVTKVGSGAFYGASISQITLGKVTEILQQAFMGLVADTTIDLSQCDELPAIGNQAFYQIKYIKVTLIVRSEDMKTAFEGALASEIERERLTVQVRK